MAHMERLKTLVRDVVGSVVVVLLVLGALWAYAGMWPPMVVIESGSMQHSRDSSAVGVIDTGDLTLVRSSDRAGRIVTWAEGRLNGHSSYGNYGDVIVFHKNGLEEYTPVIHRAMVWIELNSTTGDSFDVPSMGEWDTLRITLRGLRTYHTGSESTVDLTVNLQVVLDNFRGHGDPHGGYLTKGDNNPNIDQISLFWEAQPPGTTPRAEPVMREWVVGVSRGELPWFGILKLWFGGGGKGVPSNSWYDLLITVALLVMLPVLIDLVIALEAALRPEGAPGPWSRLLRRRSGEGVAAGGPPAGTEVPTGGPSTPAAQAVAGPPVVYRVTAPAPHPAPASYPAPAPVPAPDPAPSPPRVDWDPEPPAGQAVDPSPAPPPARPPQVVYRYVDPSTPREAERANLNDRRRA